MKTKLLAIAMAAAALSGCAAVQSGAEPREACFGPQWEPAAVRAAIADQDANVRYRELTAAERARFLKAWNAAPPEGGFLFDTIGYFEKPGAPVVAVLFMERGCVWTYQPIPREAFFGAIRGGVDS